MLRDRRPACVAHTEAAGERAAGWWPTPPGAGHGFLLDLAGDDGAVLATTRGEAGPLECNEALAEISGVQCRENRVAEAVAMARGMASPGARCGALAVPA